jgi:hypothetical protein
VYLGDEILEELQGLVSISRGGARSRDDIRQRVDERACLNRACVAQKKKKIECAERVSFIDTMVADC